MSLQAQVLESFLFVYSSTACAADHDFSGVTGGGRAGGPECPPETSDREMGNFCCRIGKKRGKENMENGAERKENVKKGRWKNENGRKN